MWMVMDIVCKLVAAYIGIGLIATVIVDNSSKKKTTLNPTVEQSVQKIKEVVRQPMTPLYTYYSPPIKQATKEEVEQYKILLQQQMTNTSEQIIASSLENRLVGSIPHPSYWSRFRPEAMNGYNSIVTETDPIMREWSINRDP